MCGFDGSVAIAGLDLVGQHQDLGVLGGVRAGEQRQPAQHANEHQVDESEGHSGRSCWPRQGRVMLRSASEKVLLRERDGVLGTHKVRRFVLHAHAAEPRP
jgi:hypothetical protein